ncbi:MAG: 2-amino-4-hydroxy-6-hydroxymethyldihydropteridine diphosphokinase [Deltaproteobacteria bacterium]|nr:2-amino-4-hydroxy-6-hydroxymethyldihydropteridine diphosphokinase [Deltaproteobacteria bacterium]
MEVYVGFGANLGRRLASISRALFQVDALPGTRIKAVSPIYETAPVGYLEQGDFLNGVCCLETAMEPVALLQALLRIEKTLGRVRTVHWGPRTIDLDLLFFAGLIIRRPELRLPHPRLAARGFVLYPLYDLAPGLRHPELGVTVAALLTAWRRAAGAAEPPVQRTGYRLGLPRAGRSGNTGNN